MANRFYGLIRPIIIFVVLAVILLSAFSSACSPGGALRTVAPLIIGSSHNEADTLIYIAYERGFFTANGLDVSIKDYSSGSAAVAGMLNGEVDIATGSEFVIVQDAFKHRAVLSIGVISKNWSVSLVARTDRGIRTLSDLEGKKVGVPVGTLAQFHLGRFLDLNGMHGKPIALVNIDITQSVDVLINGDVDAVQSWEPYVSRIREKLGDKVVTWPAQSGQPQYKNVTVTAAWLAQQPDLAKRVLKSLAEADNFVALHPDMTKTIIQKRLQYDDQYISSVWPLNEVSLSLNQSLITAMEDEARWMIANNLTAEKLPNFNDYIYEDTLKAIKPEAVNIIR